MREISVARITDLKKILNEDSGEQSQSSDLSITQEEEIWGPFMELSVALSRCKCILQMPLTTGRPDPGLLGVNFGRNFTKSDATERTEIDPLHSERKKKKKF